jgi:hypothetical protein
MSERDPSQRGELSSQADRTLLGVAPPKLETSTDALPRSPVFVRSGTSVADVEPPPLPRMALPSRPPRAMPEVPGVSQAPAGMAERGYGLAWVMAVLKLPARVAGAEVALWMVLGPALFAAALLLVLVGSFVGGSAPAQQSLAVSGSALGSSPVAPATPVQPAKSPSPSLAGLAGKPPELLSSRELLSLAEGRAETERDAAKALRLKVEASPALGKDKSVQGELLRLAGDTETARDALAAMAALEAPIGADLLYEVWTGTSQKTETTELARTLVYSTDVRPKASPALSVALELRIAERCEQYQTALPKALKDGDRRALHLLTKLSAKRGCGPKKNEDCFACLREQTDELTATINAVKSRRAPVYLAPLP